MPEAKRKPLGEQYALQAVDYLRHAIKQGFKDVEDLKRNKDFDSLQLRADFKKLIAELEAKNPPTKKEAPPPQKEP